MYAPRGVELVIKGVDTACQGLTCKALRAFVKVDKRYKIALIKLNTSDIGRERYVDC